MKPFQVLFFLGIILLFQNCSPIIKLLYGIHQPKVLTKEKITRFLTKNNLDTTNNVAITEKNYLYVINKIEMTFPEIMVFDRNGNLIPYKKNNECNASAFKFIDSLSPLKNYSLIDSVNLSLFEKTLCDLNGKIQAKIIDPKANYYLLIFWTEWTGKLNKNHTYVWEQKAKNNKNVFIKTIKVNCDFQSFWSEVEREKNIKALLAPEKKK